MCPFLGLAQAIPRTTNDHVELVGDVEADHLVQAQRARNAVDDREHVRAEARLQLRMLVEVVEHHLRDRVTLDRDDDAHTDTVGGLVVDLGDARELAVPNLLGDRGDQVVRVDLVGQLGDDDRGATVGILFDLDDAAHTDRAAAGGVRILDTLATDDESVRREVGALDAFHAGRERRFFVGLEVVESPEHRVAEFTQVVRRDVGGHTDGDAVGAVHQQVRHARRKYRRLLGLAVVVGDEVDGFLVDVAQHLHRERGQPRLGVTHGCGAVVATRAEVALAVDQRVPHRPRLGQTHQCVVDRGVAVGVVVTHRLGNGACGFYVAAVGAEARVVHRVQHAAVHRLESVTHLGQCTPDDDAHRVIDVAALHFLLDVDRIDPVSALGVGGRTRRGSYRRFGDVRHTNLLEKRSPPRTERNHRCVKGSD